jgi:hypothetical protein
MKLSVVNDVHEMMLQRCWFENRDTIDYIGGYELEGSRKVANYVLSLDSSSLSFPWPVLLRFWALPSGSLLALHFVGAVNVWDEPIYDVRLDVTHSEKHWKVRAKRSAWWSNRLLRACQRHGFLINLFLAQYSLNSRKSRCVRCALSAPILLTRRLGSF